MTMEVLFNKVESAASQYEQACQQEEVLYDMIGDAENDINRYSSQASSSEDASEQRAALEQMNAAALRLQQYQNQLQQVQSAKAHALRYLQTARSELANVIKSIEDALTKIDGSISVFEQMASNPFGASAASQLPQLRARRAEYQQNLNDAYTLTDRIDSVLNGSGNSPQLVLRRR
ncbi:MAG: hypothetical protein NC409_10150 [Clostridium sp.]|nr:hypothetical protein [Clostridium sp.]